MRTLGRAAWMEAARPLRSSRLLGCVDDRCAAQCINRRRRRCAQHPTLQPSATRRGRSDDATRPSAQSLASAQAHNIAALILNPFDCTMMTAALSAIDQPAAPPAVASPAPHRPHSFTAMSTVRQRDIKLQQAAALPPESLPPGATSPYSPSKPDPTPASKTLLVDEDPSKKWRSAWVRTYTTFIMMGGFVVLFMLGHMPLMALLVAIQIAMFKEVKRLSKVLSTQQALPSFRPLHWYWFFTAMFFSYGRVLASYFHYAIPYHTFISFALYMIGVVMFVLSLETGYYRYQFEMFAWVHLTLLLIVVQSTVIVVNMFSGLIWFILPALLIISNDTWAYIFGFFFGRTPLIALSPKKTWEGFVGAFFATLLTGFFISRVLSQFQLMICEKDDLTLTHPSCAPALPYIPVPVPLPQGMQGVLSAVLGGDWSYVSISPMQWHGLALALFASIIAPFGGFFASGFKRAFNIKDFGESIPGHGGVTDRMDCQIMMGLFVFVYYQTFVKIELDLHGNFLRFQAWPQDTQVEYYQRIQEYLLTRGIIKA